MIRGGEYYEWPTDDFVDWLDEQKLVRHEEELDMEVTTMVDKEYNKYLWEKTLEDGPPQDEDTEWLKLRAYRIGTQIGLEFTKQNGDDSEIQRLIATLKQL